MQLRTLTRLSAAGALVLGIAGGVLTALAPAGALEQERIVLTEEGVSPYDYDPIIGNNPGANADASTTIDPTICSGVGCDLIPLTIEEPATADGGEFFVVIRLEWDTAEIPNVPVLGDTAVNDLDLWIQNDPLVEDAGPDEDGFAYKSAGISEPEQVNMYSPVGDWNVMVVNASGVNTGYRLTFEVITDDIPDGIFESLPPAFSGGAPPAPSTPTTIPASAFDVAPPPPVDIAPATPPLADTSFDSGFGETTSLEDQIAAAPSVQEIRPVSVTRPSAPSNLALLLWMVAFPFALLAIAGALLMRKQRTLLPALS